MLLLHDVKIYFDVLTRTDNGSSPTHKLGCLHCCDRRWHYKEIAQQYTVLDLLHRHYDVQTLRPKACETQQENLSLILEHLEAEREMSYLKKALINFFPLLFA